MRKLTLAILMAAPLLAARPIDDLERLQGQWKTVKTVTFGRELADRSVVLHVEGNRFTSTETSISTGTITLDPKREPKVFEMTRPSGNRTERGIYTLDGETFRQCTQVDGTLPTEVSSVVGSQRFLREWRRVGRPGGDVTRRADDLDGTWENVAWTANGKPIDKEVLRGFRLTVTQGRYTAENLSIQKGVIRLDSSKTPGQIDFEVSEPRMAKGTIWPGIYRLEGDTFTEDVNGNKMARPTEFGPSPKSLTHRVYERVKP